MPVTVATPAGEINRHSAGDQYTTVRTITLGVYPTGGEIVTAARVGLGRVSSGDAEIIETAVALARIIPVVQADGSLKLKAIATGQIAEVLNATDLSGTTVRLRCWGS